MAIDDSISSNKEDLEKRVAVLEKMLAGHGDATQKGEGAGELPSEADVPSHVIVPDDKLKELEKRDEYLSLKLDCIRLKEELVEAKASLHSITISSSLI